MSRRRYVIVGLGIAGLSAAEAIRARDASGEILALSAEPHPPYSRPGLAYLLARAIPERQLQLRTPAELADLDLTRVFANVDRVDPDAHAVTDTMGRSHAYDRLVIATGSKSVAPPFPGGDLDGVVQLDGLDDARDFVRRARHAREAIVVGGGPTAIEMVDGLLAHHVRTRYFLRGDRYWSSVLDHAESEIVLDKLVREGAIVHAHVEVARAIGERGRLAGVETNQGERFGCDLLCVAIGVRPRAELTTRTDGANDSGIEVDDHMCAGDDVYAAGDVAWTRDHQRGEATGDVLWSSALEQGAIAGANMAGARLRYETAVSLNVTRLAGIATTVIGRVGEGEDFDLVALSRGESRRWRHRPKAWTMVDQAGYDRLRVVAAERRIIGAVVMGDQGLSRLLVRAIRADLDLSPIWDGLVAAPDAALPLLLDFAERSQELGHAARAG